MRFLPAIAVLAVLASGCKKEKDGTDDVGDDDDDNEPTALTADTAPEPGKRAAEVRFRAYVAWDAGLRAVVPPIIDGSDTFISAYIISLYEEGWTSADESTYCQIALDLEGLPQSSDAVTDGFLWGIDIPEGDKPMFTDCLEKGFDPDQWTNGDPLQDWGPIDWQLRLGGTMTQTLIDWLTPTTPTADFDISEYAAGDWSTQTGGYSADPDDNYWYAYAMDAAHNVDFDTRLLDAEMAAGVGQLATAYFVFDQRVYWSLDE